jgi:hypothetical protein
LTPLYRILDQRQDMCMVQINVDLIGTLLVEIPTDVLPLVEWNEGINLDKGLIHFHIDGEPSEGFTFHRVETAEN